MDIKILHYTNVSIEHRKVHVKGSRTKACVREWAETASCHGLPHMAQANTIGAIIIWSVILALCFLGFIYLFTSTLSQYLRFEKVVTLKLGLESTDFPSVTFCNINPYKKSKIRSVPELDALKHGEKNAEIINY
uniref:Amiloride-sensitive cation channel 5 n=1 Tax=Heterorhabditis bacteriophora TaxID=37862 RepID=A0A1I7XBL9_HETBA